MLYYLLYHVLQKYFSPLNVFRYITVRTVYASLTGMFLALVFGPWLIRRLRELQIGQFIREEGPQAHKKKAGTPTMGGVGLLELSTHCAYSTQLMVPFFKKFQPDLVIHSLLNSGHLWTLAFLPFLLFVTIVITGSSNAVNLTDGLDGLAIGCTVIAA